MLGARTEKRCPEDKYIVIAPKVEGRIINIASHENYVNEDRL
jgi:hypothetical protein